MKLLYILKEAITESKIIKVPEEVLDLAEKQYDYIVSNIDFFKSKSSNNINTPYIPSKLNKIFKLKDLKNNDIEISIGFYNDPEDVGAGRMNTDKGILLINLASFPEKEEYMNIIEHELVHAMDHKVRNKELYSREYAKKGAEPVGSRFQLSKSNPTAPTEFTKNFTKYVKSPWEFDAFSTPLIKKLKKSYDKVPDKKEFKDSMGKLFSAIKTQSPKDIAEDDSELIDTAWYFSPDKWDSAKWEEVKHIFKYELSKIKYWSSKPTLYKKFLQRYANEIS